MSYDPNLPIAPHGGTLVDLLVSDADAAALKAEAANLPKLTVNERETSDLEMLATGALSPLIGFQGEADYHSILDSMHLQNGLPWSIPVTLSVDEEGAHRLGGAEAVALTAGEGGEPLAVLRISDLARFSAVGTHEIELERGSPRSATDRGGEIRCARSARR